MSDEFHSPGYAVEKGIDYQTSAERAKALSMIPDDNARHRLALAYAVGGTDDSPGIFPFLSTYADNLLLLYVSDKKGTGRAMMTEILKATQIANKETMRDKLMGFLGRGNE